jgi:hypothetical protein
MGTKERWNSPLVLEEVRYLKSVNFNFLTLADKQVRVVFM